MTNYVERLKAINERVYGKNIKLPDLFKTYIVFTKEPVQDIHSIDIEFDFPLNEFSVKIYPRLGIFESEYMKLDQLEEVMEILENIEIVEE